MYYANIENKKLYRGGQFFWWRKPECPEKTTALSQVTDKLYRLHFAMNWVRITTLVMIGTDYTGNCKSNYHAITVMTAPSGNRI